MPAQAAMGCWNSTQVAAAKVRDLQSRLMVATLRCQAMGADVTEPYNRFVRANRETIQGANAVLLAQFRSGYGSQGQTQYDRFATALANIYGADATDHAICADTAALPRKRRRRPATSPNWWRSRTGSASPRTCRAANAATASPRRRTGTESTYKDIFIFAFAGGRG